MSTALRWPPRARARDELAFAWAWSSPGGGAEEGSGRGGAEFTLTRAPRGLGSSTIGPGVASMGTIHPGSNGRRALLQDEKYKLSLCPVASGYWVLGIGVSGIGYRVTGRTQKYTRFGHPAGSTDQLSFAPCTASRARGGLGS